jgi:hypothetical protein
MGAIGLRRCHTHSEVFINGSFVMFEGCSKDPHLFW